MQILKTTPHLTDSELLRIMKSQTEVRSFIDWQIIYSVQTNYGNKAKDYANILGVTESKIKRVIQSYNKLGKDWKRNVRWGGRREARCIMTLEEEKKILDDLEDEALAGNVLIYKELKEIVENKINDTVSDDYIWDLFKRHNWTKKVPRPSHPKSDKAKQEDYKKNSKRIWKPSL